MNEHLNARVHKGLMLPRLLFGLPWTFAAMTALLSYWAIVIVHLYVFGFILFVFMYGLGRWLASRDIFFIDFIFAIPRFKGVLS